MYLHEVSTGKILEAVIEPMANNDFKVIKKDKNRFNKFNWSEYRSHEVYKLRLKNEDVILGLICIIDHNEEATNAIEIELLEVSEENTGAKKLLDGIGGCLIAFACRESFKRGHDGIVFLTPKTQLVNYYSEKYGFYHLNLKSVKRPEGLMVLLEEDSRKLIKKYFL